MNMTSSRKCKQQWLLGMAAAFLVVVLSASATMAEAAAVETTASSLSLSLGQSAAFVGVAHDAVLPEQQQQQQRRRRLDDTEDEGVEEEDNDPKDDNEEDDEGEEKDQDEDDEKAEKEEDDDDKEDEETFTPKTGMEEELKPLLPANRPAVTLPVVVVANKEDAKEQEEDDNDEDEDDADDKRVNLDEQDDEADRPPVQADSKEDDEEEEDADDQEDDKKNDDEEEEDAKEDDEPEQKDEGDDEEEEEEEEEPQDTRPAGPAPGAAKAAMFGRNEIMDPTLKGAIQQKLAAQQQRRGIHLLRNRPKHYQKLMTAQQQQQQQQGNTNKNAATDSMAAHKPFTQEYVLRRQRILDRIQKTKGRAVRERVEQRWKEIEASRGRGNQQQPRLPFRKELRQPRLVERLPVVKRLTKLSPEEELMLDTSLSLIHALKHDTYQGKQEPLSIPKKRALQAWLQLLSVTLPEEWGIHDTLDDLLGNINFITKGETYFLSVINRHPVARKHWSPSCTKHGPGFTGFTCGFWKLMHVMTIGLAQHRGGQTLIDSGMRKPDTSVFSPADAADIMRDYIQEFFNCQVCAKLFVATYQDCTKNRRCDRLAHTAESASDADWKEMAKWLWEVHNDINVRLVRERASHKSLGMKMSRAQTSMATTTIAALWPTLEECITCFESDGSWNENAVFLYLELEFWPQEDSNSKMSRLLQFDEELTEDTVQFGLFWILLLVGIALGYSLIQNKNALQATIRQVRSSIARGDVASMVVVDKVAAQKRSE